MNRKDLYHLRPDVFIKESLSFMQGYPKIKVWLYMPIAYIKVCYYTLLNKKPMNNYNSHEKEFVSVLKTLKNNKVMVDTREDGIYIRLAGKEGKGEAFSLEWAKVLSFTNPKPLTNE